MAENVIFTNLRVVKYCPHFIDFFFFREMVERVVWRSVDLQEMVFVKFIQPQECDAGAVTL